jgi:hypothetical protein
MRTTTDLKIVRRWNKFYTLGHIIKIHDIGEYSVIEYIDKMDNDSSFACYVNGERLASSFGSLDDALIDCIAAKNGTVHFSNAASRLITN